MVDVDVSAVSADLLAWVQAGVDRGAELIDEQAPLFAAEIILYGRVANTATFVIVVSVLVASVYYFRRTFKKAFNEQADLASDILLCILGCVTCFIAAFASIMYIVQCFHDMVLVWTAPRLYIVKYLSHLL